MSKSIIEDINTLRKRLNPNADNAINEAFDALAVRVQTETGGVLDSTDDDLIEISEGFHVRCADVSVIIAIKHPGTRTAQGMTPARTFVQMTAGSVNFLIWSKIGDSDTVFGEAQSIAARYREVVNAGK